MSSEPRPAQRPDIKAPSPPVETNPPRYLSAELGDRLFADLRSTDIAMVVFAGLILFSTIVLAGRTSRLHKSTEKLLKIVEDQRGDIQMSMEIAKQSAQAAAESAQALSVQTTNVATSLAIAESAATAADEAAKAAAESARATTAQSAQTATSLSIAEQAASAANTAAKAATQSATAAERQFTELMSSIGRARDTAEAARELAASAKQRADTAVTADRPHVFASNLCLHGLKQAPDANGLVPVFLSYEFVNYGRSPALIKGISLTVTTSQLPEAPAYGPASAVRQVVPVQGAFRAPRPIEVFKLPPMAIENLRRSELTVAVFGYVDYADAQGQGHRTAFLYEFAFKEGDESNGFQPIGTEAYWQYT